jgi:hypothetical protein
VGWREWMAARIVSLWTLECGSTNFWTSLVYLLACQTCRKLGTCEKLRKGKVEGSVVVNFFQVCAKIPYGWLMSFTKGFVFVLILYWGLNLPCPTFFTTCVYLIKQGKSSIFN